MKLTWAQIEELLELLDDAYTTWIASGGEEGRIDRFWENLTVPRTCLMPGEQIIRFNKQGRD